MANLASKEYNKVPKNTTATPEPAEAPAELQELPKVKFGILLGRLRTWKPHSGVRQCLVLSCLNLSPRP